VDDSVGLTDSGQGAMRRSGSICAD